MTLLLILAPFLFDSQIGDESPRQRFYRAFFSEVAERKIQEPLAVYRSLLDEFGKAPELRARVRMRIASCELKLGNRDAALDFVQLARQVPDIGSDIVKQIESLQRSIEGKSAASGPPEAEPRKEPAEDPEPVDTAVERALEYLLGVQEPTGAWRSDGELEGHDAGVTGLAILAFVRSGHTHLASPRADFRNAVRRGVRWLLAQQTDSSEDRFDGAFGNRALEQWIYDHGAASLALAELLLVSRDPELEGPVRKALECTLHRQNPEYGWRYRHREYNDTSVTAWLTASVVVARRLQQDGWLDGVAPERVGTSLRWARNWVNRTTARTGKTGYVAPGDPGAQWTGYPEPYPYSKSLPVMTAAGLCLRQWTGESKSDPMVRKQIELLLANLPQWREARGKRKSKVNFIYWYWGTAALVYGGGPPAIQWRDAVYQALIPHQQGNGSWDPIGEWGAPAGRIYTTAIAAYTLRWIQRGTRERN